MTYICFVPTHEASTLSEATEATRVRWGRWHAVVVFAALALVVVIPLFSANFRTLDNPDGPPYAGDFLQEYVGGWVLLHGDRDRVYDLAYAQELQHDPAVMGMRFDEREFLPIIYPPFYYWLATPLTLLPFNVAALVWLALMTACLAATALLLQRAYPQHQRLIAGLVVAALLFTPLLENLASSQKATVSLLILTGTFLLLDRRRHFAAGLLFGLLAFKPQLTLVIGLAMLCKGQWRFVLGGLATGVVLVGLSLLVSPEACRQYLQISKTMAEYINTPGFAHEKLHCWYGFFRLLLDGQPLIVIQAATLLAASVTIAALFRLLAGPLPFGQPGFAVQYAGLVVATVLLSPHLLTYDLTLLLLPLFLVTRLLLERAALLVETRGTVAWMLLLAFAVPSLSTVVAKQTHFQASVLVLFLLLWTLGRLARNPRRAVDNVRTMPADSTSAPIAI
jgi:alpha-1,2-mannosyltransferase